MTFSGLGKSLYEIWQTLPRQESFSLPCWQDVKASHLAPVLAQSWIMEYRAPASLIMRFVGSAVERVRGNTTGDDFLQTYIPASHQNFILAAFRATHDAPSGGIFVRRLARPGEQARMMTSSALPLADATGATWAIVGVTEASNSKDDLHLGTDTKEEFLPPQYVDIGYGLPDAIPELP